MQSLCTLRNHCRQWPRNTRYQADATPYLGRTCTGWIAPALPGALILFTTRARRSYLAHAFRRGDVLLFGRETSGVPEKVHAAADARLVIPMREGLRSLNVAMAAAMAVGEAMRQTAAPPSQSTRHSRRDSSKP